MLTIKEIIKTLNNAFNQKLKKYRGNWEQNDPTADDYIRNRPFYTDETNPTIILSEQVINDVNAKLKESLIVGETYIVTFNGTDYTCICKDYDGYRMLGNNAIYEYDGGITTDTGEPFALETDGDNKEVWFAFKNESETPTVKIGRAKIVKIDKKYLPDDLITDLAPVATSGSYNDLSDTPTVYTDVVRYNTSQSLSTTQKNTSRTNIGAVGYEAQTLNADQKAQARTNIGAVGYESQSFLTTSQKTLARANIGAGTSSFSGNYNDLTNKPTIPTVPNDIVRYNIAQFFDDTAKARARNNIGAGTSNFDGKFSSLTENPLVYLNIPEEEPVYNQLTSYQQLVKYDNIDSLVLCNDGDLPFGCYLRDESRDGNSYRIINVINNFSPIHLFCADGTEGLIVGETYGFVSAGLGIRRSKPYEKVYRALRVVEIRDKNYARFIDDSATIIPSNVPFIQSAQVGQTIAVKSVDENGKPTEWETVDGSKDTISLVDQVNGYTYIACMRDGNFVTYCAAKYIEITTIPAKTEYMAGEYFDPTGMIVTATAQDGSTREITNYTYPTVCLAEGAISVGITYVENGTTHTATVPVTVIPFDPAVVLVDFEYTANEDGTCTITGWKGTYNGEASTEIIIPNNGLIIV